MRKILAIINVWVLAFNLVYIIVTWSGNWITILISAIGFSIAYITDTKKNQPKEYGTLDDHLLK